jgi:hypothetical protein
MSTAVDLAICVLEQAYTDGLLNQEDRKRLGAIYAGASRRMYASHTLGPENLERLRRLLQQGPMSLSGLSAALGVRKESTRAGLLALGAVGVGKAPRRGGTKGKGETIWALEGA